MNSLQKLCARYYSGGVVLPLSLKSPFFARSWFLCEKTRNGLEKASALSADVVILDLEDTVASQEKSTVRSEYNRALNDGVFLSKRVFVRVDCITTAAEEVREDLKTFTRPEVAGFILPKLKHPDQVREVDELLTSIERERNLQHNLTKLVPMLELAEAYFQSDLIASCSKRNICVLAASADFTASTACEDHSPTYDAFFGRAVMAAKAAGIEAVCGIHDKLDDYAGLEKFCIKMKRSGFVGAIALTPHQIHIINNAFNRTRREIIWMEQALEANIKFIQPSVQESRQLIGPPHKEKASFMRAQHEAHIEEFMPPKKHTAGATIKGMRIKSGLSPDMKLGELIQNPLQVSITDSWKSLWESAFLSTKGYFNSMAQSNKLGFESMPLPFSLMATIATAFSVFNLTCHARLHLSFKNMFQHRPVLSGDTVRAMFVINNIDEKRGGDGNQYHITNSTHWMINQRNEVVFQMDKSTMFSPSDCNINKTGSPCTVQKQDPQQSKFRYHLLKQPEENFFPYFSGPVLTPGQLLVHDFVKVMGDSEVRMLCTLLNFYHPHHFNQLRYQATDILVPGLFVMSAALSGSAIDIGEVIYEDIPYSINPNKVNFGDQIGTVTYVESCRPLPNSRHLEEVNLKHFALKNTDMEILSEMDIPKQFFESKTMKPHEYEAICSTEFPMLLHKIVCVTERRIIRVRPGFVKPRITLQDFVM